MAAAVERISLSRPRASSGQGRSQVPVQVFDRRSGRFIIESSGTLVIPTRVPAGAAELVVEASLADGASSAGAELELSVRSIDSSREETASLEVADSWLGGATRPARRQIPVAGFEGDLCLVTYTTDLAIVSGKMP